MDADAQLSQREELILRAVVHTYITTAEPVGSRSIVRRFNLDLSPATARNTMADLEEAGFLQQLHTSSGRVPTDQGYRYYVDYLMQVQELTLGERQRIERQLSEQLNNVDDLMRQTCHLLALATHQAGIVASPAEDSAEVRHVELMPLAGPRVAVLIADSLGRVHTLMGSLDEPMPPDELSRLARFLNDQVQGVSTDQLAATVRLHMETVRDEQRRLSEQALRLLDVLPLNRPGQLFLEGATQLFEQPEFRDVAKAREVLGLLDERDRLFELLRTSVTKSERVRAAVVIGSEAKDRGLGGISLVASPYCVDGKPVGMLGVLGPRRMPYSRLTAVVDYTAGMLGRFLGRFAG